MEVKLEEKKTTYIEWLEQEMDLDEYVFDNMTNLSDEELTL